MLPLSVESINFFVNLRISEDVDQHVFQTYWKTTQPLMSPSCGISLMSEFTKHACFGSSSILNRNWQHINTSS